MGWISLCDVSELHEGAGKYVQIDGFELAVFLHEGRVYVLDNTCPHAGGPLADGFVENGCAICPWHYWTFNLETGAMRGQTNFGIKRYDSRIFSRPNQPDLVQADLPVY